MRYGSFWAWVLVVAMIGAGCRRDGGEPSEGEAVAPDPRPAAEVQVDAVEADDAQEAFDPEAHEEALQKLGPAHHARMYESEQARAAVAAYEEELLAQEPYQSLRADIEALRKQAGPEADEDAAGKPDETLAQKQAELEALLAQDEKWQALREEAESAQVRRENTRREIAERVRQRMRHEAAMKQAETQAAPSEVPTDQTDQSDQSDPTDPDDNLMTK